MSNAYSQNHQDGLELELSLLTAVLERNHCSHGRTKYFQRMYMAKRRIQRYGLVDLYRNLKTMEAELLDIKQTEQRRRKREQVFWELHSSTEDSKLRETRRRDHFDRLKEIGTQALEYIPEVISRLEHAAKSLIAEIARAFFLPLNAVSIAAVARIRMLLLRLGIQTLQSMPALRANTLEIYGEAIDWTADKVNNTLKTFHDLSTSDMDAMPSNEELLVRSLRLVGMPLPKMAPQKSEAMDETNEDREKVNAMNENDNGSSKFLLDVVCDQADIGEPDHGEQLAFDLDDKIPVSQPESITNSLPITSELDKNYDLVQHVALKKKEAKKRKSKEKTKSKTQGRPEKKRAKQDFFDELFGS